jgi:hypothetical protein
MLQYGIRMGTLQFGMRVWYPARRLGTLQIGIREFC